MRTPERGAKRETVGKRALAADVEDEMESEFFEMLPLAVGDKMPAKERVLQVSHPVVGATGGGGSGEGGRPVVP